MQAPCGSRAAVLRSRPPSVQSSSPPGLSKAYPQKTTKQIIGDETVKIPATKLRMPHRKLQLKTVRRKPFEQVDTPSISKNCKAGVPSPPSTPRPKFNATAYCRPVTQPSRGHTVPVRSVENVKPIVASSSFNRKPVAKTQKLGPENWTPVIAKAITSISPPPMLKVLRPKRATILPKVGARSPFDRTQSQPTVENTDGFSDSKVKSPALLPQPCSHSLSSHTIPDKPPVRSPSLEELPRAIFASSLPSYPAKRFTGTASKTVTWDPSLVFVEPEVSPIAEVPPAESQVEALTNSSPAQDFASKHDIKKYVEIINGWGETEKSKLMSVIEILWKLEHDSKRIAQGDKYTKSSNNQNEGVIIRAVKSMDPRVPEFEPFRSAKARNGTKGAGEPQKYSETNLFNEWDCNKENIPDGLLPATSQGKGFHRMKKRVSIWDDSNDSGREVGSFVNWYAEMQLREFAKRYPMTGRRASEGRQRIASSTKIGQTSQYSRDVTRVTDADNGAAPINTKECQGISSSREFDIMGTRGKRADIAKNGKGYRKCFRSRGIPRLPYSSTGESPAMIQQQLEMLLLREKEGRAFNQKPKMTLMSCGNSDFGPIGGYPSPYSEFFDYTMNAPLNAPIWVPSERLRL